MSAAPGPSSPETPPPPPLPEWAVGLPIARAFMGAGVLFEDDAGRVLLVKPSYKDGWDIPGGIIEPGESPRVAAARELVEEIGVAAPFGRLLTVDWAPDETFGDKVLWVFDGLPIDAAMQAEIRVDGDELIDVAWHPASEVTALVPGPAARRLLTALREKHSGRGVHVYAEHGETPTGDSAPHPVEDGAADRAGDDGPR